MLKTLRGKFTLVYVGLALIAAFVGAAGIWNLPRLKQSVNNLMTKNYNSISAVTKMMEAVEREDSGMLLFMDIDRQSGIDIITQYNQIFLSNFDFEKGNITEKGELDAVDKLQKDYSDYSTTIYTLQDNLNQGGAAAHDYYVNIVEPLFSVITADCWTIININRDAMFAREQDIADSTGRSIVMLLLLSIAAVAMGYVVALYFIQRFLNPIKKLSDSISRVREGSLYQQVSVRSNDEAGRLADEFNEMETRLRDYEQSSIGTLMAEKSKSMAIIRSISDPLLVLDANWRIMLINDACAEFFGIEEGNVVGRHFLEAIYDGRLFESIESLAKGGGERNGRIVRINKGGEYYFNLIVTKVNDPDMRNACVIAAFQNVTGLKELERVRTDFLATISHEFKTPLTSIMMASSLLKEEGMGGLNAEQAETVNAISEDGDRLLALVNNLLELMKIESGREVYHIQPCSVKEAVDASLKGFEESARAKSVRLSNNVAAGLPDVSADFEKIRWVVNNLIGNALKYTGAGGAVSIKANHDGKFVYISVQDTGAGIPPAYIDRIFDRFVQVERSDIEVSGTGIGLSLSKEIIRAHGGDIRVSSEMSKGSTFTFSLKIAGIEHAK